ncbi:ATP-binding protein [Kitasatospora sp. NPDC088346]|uniref:ATP-binding protein n=1 Tax=Kitasatospora sp. NPDC088346 TaxID=3364073 RepID=UPI003819FE1C
MSDASDQTGGPATGFPFVGRARELDLLLAAARHPPAVVLVEGEAGIGKSRLVREAAARLAGEQRCVLTGFCHPLREPLPYGPLVEALQKAGPALPAGGLPAAAGGLVHLLPGLADRMPPAAGRAPDPGAERMQVVQAVRAFLAALGPTVLIVEDAHWADEATRELLLLLARDLSEDLCLVLTYRAEDLPLDTPVLGAAYRRPPGTSGTVLQLTPLGEADVRDLASAALGGPVDVDLGASLFRRSEGLPLVAEEHLITLRDNRSASTRADDVPLRDVDVPHGLREAVTDRLVRLSEPAIAVVEAAAVLEVPSTEGLLYEVAGLDPEQGAAGLVEALRASVLRETDRDRYAFRHVLSRLVAYRRLPEPSRLRLHANAVRVLEARTPPPVVQVAHHTLALGDRQAWIRRAEGAADRATALGDHGTAATLLRQLLQQPDLDERTRSRVALGLAPIAGLGVDVDTNARALRTILADHRLPRATRGEIRVGLGLLLLNQGADLVGNDELARAVDELGDTSPKAVPALLALGMDEYAGPEQAERWLARAEAAVRDHEDAALVAHVRATRLSLRSWAGDPGVWAAVEELPGVGEDVMVLRQNVRAMFNVGDIAIDLGEDRRAATLLDRSLELARVSGFSVLDLYVGVDRLRLAGLAGRWDGLEHRFESLSATYPDVALVGDERDLFLGVLGLAQGRRDRAAEHFARTMRPGQPALSVTARAVAGTAAVRLAQRDPRGAWSVTRDGLAAVRRADAWPRVQGLVEVAVEAALASGAYRTAADLVAEAEAGTRGRCAPAATAELHTARGFLAEHGDPERAAAEFAEAFRLWQEIGRPYPAARAVELRARALARPRPEEAAALLVRATEVYTDLAATADLARSRRLAQELGLTRAPAPGRRGYGDQLSPREKEVADLLARSATNQEIADTLFLSRRTVEHHVANVLKKLDATRKTVAAVLDGSAPRGEDPAHS